MNFESFREKIGYQPVLLGTIALLASGALALASSATSEAIAAAEAKDLRDSLSEVLPQGMADNDFLKDTVEVQKDGKTVTIYRARQGETVKAALFKVAERGYAGDIQVLMAVDLDGRTLGVRVLKHTETPGLGDKIEVKKDNGIFDQFAGATITPRAVVKAVKGGLEFFAAHKSEITG